MNYNISSAIASTTYIDHSESDCADCFHVTWGVDENYQFGVAISATSLLIHNNNIQFCFHIFLDVLSEHYLENMRQLAKKFRIRIIIYTVLPEVFFKLPSTRIWSYAMYFRLLSFEYLGKFCSKVLYLDADVVCKGSIDELRQLDLGDKVAAVVQDISSTQEKSIKKLGMTHISNLKYFNSGVMYVDLEKWQYGDFTNKVLNLLFDPNVGGKVKYPDQDALNIIMSGKLIYLSDRYNKIYSLKNELSDKSHSLYLNTIKEDTVFIHYTGITKPWHEWADYPSAAYFYTAYQQSPWRNNALKSACTLPEKQKKYKHEMSQGYYFRGLAACINYNLNKFFVRWSKK
ncbi:lipopolysaccharide 1,2-glucosyltransferase [Erwinia sp. CPCC 100877]|nr:lipopolysaccharide 1,2-glucosyltransferase [Erwinia sp. CPCC 100877]